MEEREAGQQQRAATSSQDSMLGVGVSLPSPDQVSDTHYTIITGSGLDQVYTTGALGKTSNDKHLFQISSAFMFNTF